MPQPNPTDRMIRLGDALEEFYAEQMAKAAREGQRLTAVYPAKDAVSNPVRECNCGKSGSHPRTIECLGGVQ